MHRLGFDPEGSSETPAMTKAHRGTAVGLLNARGDWGRTDWGTCASLRKRCQSV